MESLTWKSVFYRFIEDYRKRIRKLSGAETSAAKQKLEEARPPAVWGFKPCRGSPLPQTIGEFTVFLRDGLLYYTRLSNRLRARSPRRGASAPPLTPPARPTWAQPPLSPPSPAASSTRAT